MKKSLVGCLFLLVIFSLSACQPASPTNGLEPSNSSSSPGEAEEVQEITQAEDEFSLIWQDEFEGDQLNPENWTYDLGGGGWRSVASASQSLSWAVGMRRFHRP